MPTIVVKDPTLLSRLDKYKQNPADVAYDDVLYELLKRAESKSEGRPSLRGFDDLPRLVVEEVRKALDGKLVEALKSAILPAVSELSVEIPVELSIRVRMRLEPVLELAQRDNSMSYNSGGPPSTGDKDGLAKIVEIDELERKAIELLRARGGCWEGSAYSLARHIASDARQAVWALESRLRRRLRRVDGKICLPETAAETAVAQQ